MLIDHLQTKLDALATQKLTRVLREAGSATAPHRASRCRAPVAQHANC